MDNQKVRVRIAPSPTGFAHVGTAYAALLNYAFARKNKGDFILRLEDTDVKRNVSQAESAIYEGLSWLGLSWDEGPDKGGKFAPYRQSQRLKTYQNKAEELIEKGLAYKEDGAIRFKNPGEDIEWNDLIRGEIKFPGGEVGDFVIIKSDGYPTYNFGVVIDDVLMEISDVIRGEEHISNTPRQIALYRAFNEIAPNFGHFSDLRNAERKKLSKRRDPVDLRLFRDDGYLPQALVNFLCLLGWSHPQGKEIFGLNEFVENFSLDRIRKAGPVFDVKKLDWINGEYIRQARLDELNSKFEIRNSKFAKLDKVKQMAITVLVRDRIHKLSEFETLAGFFFEKRKASRSLFGKRNKDHLTAAQETLANISDWKKEKVDEELMKAVKENNFKTGDFFMDLRIAICASKTTPPINDSIVILGQKESLTRISVYL